MKKEMCVDLSAKKIRLLEEEGITIGEFKKRYIKKLKGGKKYNDKLLG
jgi:hypothetical protein